MCDQSKKRDDSERHGPDVGAWELSETAWEFVGVHRELPAIRMATRTDSRGWPMLRPGKLKFSSTYHHYLRR